MQYSVDMVPIGYICGVKRGGGSSEKPDDCVKISLPQHNFDFLWINEASKWHLARKFSLK